MFKLIWVGLAYELIFINQDPYVQYRTAGLTDIAPEPSKVINIEEGRQSWLMEAQNFGFCLLPAK